MVDVILDTLLDSVKLIPFLFITYLIMEYIEHKTSKKTRETIKKSGKYGPIIGSLLGIVPQCGFSVSATNLYAGRIITIGTLIAVYLSTSDEMLPVMISEAVPLSTIFTILGIKFIIGMIFGVIIDFVFKIKNKNQEEEYIVDICEKEHCHCEKGILKSTLKHTIQIFVYIVIVVFVLNIIIFFIGEENISQFLEQQPVIGPVISSIIGLIPNCASSVIITELYLKNAINVGTLISGLLVNAGIGLIVLFRMNRNIKENIKIVAILYSIGVISGTIIQLLGITI